MSRRSNAQKRNRARYHNRTTVLVPANLIDEARRCHPGAAVVTVPMAETDWFMWTQRRKGPLYV